MGGCLAKSQPETKATGANTGGETKTEEPAKETAKTAAQEQETEKPKEPEPKKNPVDKIEVGQVVTTANGTEGKVTARTTTDFTIMTEKGEVTIPAEDIMLINIVIKSARGLRNADWKYVDGVSDPFCICEILNKDDTMKLQTLVVKDSLEVEWMHEEGIYGYKKGDSLKFSVFDKDPFKSDALGSAVLRSDRFHADGFEGELKLEGKGAGTDSFLSIKVVKPMTEEEYVEAVIEGKDEAKTCCC